MLLDCPYCGLSMKRKLIRSVPAPGERKFLPMKAIAVCPHCKQPLATNVHWAELATVTVGRAILLLVLSVKLLPLWLTLMLMAAAAVAMAVLDWRYLSQWQRFKRHDTP